MVLIFLLLCFLISTKAYTKRQICKRECRSDFDQCISMTNHPNDFPECRKGKSICLKKCRKKEEERQKKKHQECFQSCRKVLKACFSLKGSIQVIEKCVEKSSFHCVLRCTNLREKLKTSLNN